MMPNDCTNPSSVTCSCKFCRRPLAVQYDAACAPRLEHWIPLIACNRCADFNSGRLSFIESVWRTCYSLKVFLDSTDDPALRNEATGQARKKLNEKSRGFAKHVCDYFRLTLVWEPELTQMLLDKPLKAKHILAIYESNISKLSKAA